MAWTSSRMLAPGSSWKPVRSPSGCPEVPSVSSSAQRQPEYLGCPRCTNLDRFIANAEAMSKFSFTIEVVLEHS
jgi:hypothetical protein